MAGRTPTKGQAGAWNFLTNHACVLLTVAQQPDIRISEIADVVGITERATHRILMDLVREGYLSVQKNGRRNSYKFQGDLPLKRAAFSGFPIRNLVDALSPSRS